MKRSREPEESPSPSTPGSDDLEPPTPDERALPQDNHSHKIAELDLSDSETASSPAMRCLLHKDALFFGSYDEYESHYSKAHLNKCLECRKNFPSAHLLAVHIEECHDAFAAVRREKGEHTYTCFVEGCDRKCATPDKRRRHLIDKHLYPKNFFFAVTRDGIDGRQSLLQDGRYGHRRKSSGRHASIKDEQRRASIAESSSSAEGKPKAAPAADKLESGETRAKATKDPREVPDVDMDDLTGAMSALKFVPPSIRFGRGGRAGFSRR